MSQAAGCWGGMPVEQHLFSRMAVKLSYESEQALGNYCTIF